MNVQKPFSAASDEAIRRQSQLVEWVWRHELVLFFVSTFLFSWIIYGILAKNVPENNTTFSRLLLIPAYAASLSAILLSSIPARRAGKKDNVRQLWLAMNGRTTSDRDTRSIPTNKLYSSGNLDEKRTYMTKLLSSRLPAL